ncbi:PREDICTED: zinc-finger homeodomain protein 9-like isoform X2 [Lupinus angustifolius]|uniref:zinc-finger homeodomain protein 9-like isoform X2 n=1 Tax=Lupinus angustifolius TaxID=3871 RepID=UPI00092F0E58|nr:PREDICTED: zinc-finger homeodomain protein 9-like isoform X2 [Lupinus angustifolius]
MDLTPTICKDTQTPPLTQPINLNPTKSLSFTNGTLKHHSSSTTTTTTATVPPSSSTAVSYKECLKNHAASIGGHAIDGCGEFMASSTAIPTDPRSLICAACGCHRNFHRRDPQEPQPPPPPTFLTCFYSTTPSSVTPTAPPPPPQLPHRAMSQSTSPSLSSSPSHSPSPMSSTPSSPPPLSHVPPSSYAAPHMLLALGNNNNAYSIDYQNRNFHSSSLVLKTETISLSGRKRYRTKFSLEQKEKMFRFSEKLGWRMQKGDDRSVQEFCSEIGVARGVFKVWMHNNKNTLRKKSESAPQIEKTDSDKEVGNGNGDGINKNEDNCADVHVSFNGLSS